MKLGIMQPYFFPYIGYFQLIRAVDKYILYENLEYIKDGWMHKNRVLVKNHGPTNISLKILGKSSFKKIVEITLVNDDRWKRKLLRTIQQNYSNSVYYQEVYPLIEFLINMPEKNLHVYNSKIILAICNYLDIETYVQYQNTNYLDLEKKIQDKFDLQRKDNNSQLNIYDENYEKKTVRVIEICKQESAKMFINAIGGKSLYSKNQFFQHGIDLFFLKTKNISYKQLSAEFFPNLSIIDVLMNCGKLGTKKLLKEYKLV
jgi:hypothetical protein